MFYKNTDELPVQIQKSLLAGHQEAYLKIFNAAWEQYKDDDFFKNRKERESAAHQVAWEAVTVPPVSADK